jgi:lipopolysaccharide assembly protein A
MRIIKLFFLMVVVMLGVVFTVLNADPVQFNYYFGSRELPLSLIMTVALGVGVLLGIVSCMGLMFGMKRENLSLKRKSLLTSQEVNNLRALPLKDR